MVRASEAYWWYNKNQEDSIGSAKWEKRKRRQRRKWGEAVMQDIRDQQLSKLIGNKKSRIWTDGKISSGYKPLRHSLLLILETSLKRIIKTVVLLSN